MVVIEDLISTGGSVISVVEALRDAGADVLGVVSIFTYGMQKSGEELLYAQVDMAASARVRAARPYTNLRRPALYR